MPLVHLVEDDASLAGALDIALRAEGYDVRVLPTLRAARAALAVEAPDLLLLDLGLPDGDGLELCRAARARAPGLPLLVLTARGTLESRLEGFREGADDYLVKPFDLEELLARCQAVLRRAGPRFAAAGPIEIGRLRLDPTTREATSGGRAVELTELEIRFLTYLHARRDAVVSREDVLRDVWRMPGVRSRTVDTFVSRLRKWTEEDPARPEVLLTVRGIGYRLKATGSD